MRVIEFRLVLLAVLLIKTMTSDQGDNAAWIIGADNKLTLTMYDWLRQVPGNVLYSPLGLVTTLSMLYQAAEGETLRVLSSTLNLSDKASSADGVERILKELNNIDGVTIEIRNKLHINGRFSAVKTRSQKVLAHKFSASISSGDFTRESEQNEVLFFWVRERNLHSIIVNLFSGTHFDYYVTSVITNVIYFNGDWLMKFDKSSTSKKPFYTSETDHVDVDMMHLTAEFDHKVDRVLDAQIIKLPYVNKNLSMVIVFPNKRVGITELGDKLANYDLSTLTQGMDNTAFELTMPRFKIDMKMDLKEPLKKAGLTNIFSRKSNLSGLLFTLRSLYVQKVWQNTFIEVNEEGSVAAAVSGGLVKERRNERGQWSGNISTDAELILNNPFIFAIEFNSNILFYGKLASFD